MNLCHCEQPATWMLRVVPLDHGVVSNMADDTWATCDEHIGTAADAMIARNIMKYKILVLRRDPS